MTGFQLLLLVLTLAGIILGVVAAIAEVATRWLALSVTCISGYLFVLVLHGL